MNWGAARGRGLRGWGQWLAAAMLILAFATLALLPAPAHALPAGHMAHAGTAAAADCPHSPAGVSSVQPGQGDQDGPDAGHPASPDDCCTQLCTITALLPEGARSAPPLAGEAVPRLRADRPGRTPDRILRPPRSSAAA